jgi:hypothetical protein
MGDPFENPEKRKNARNRLVIAHMKEVIERNGR